MNPYFKIEKLNRDVIATSQILECCISIGYVGPNDFDYYQYEEGDSISEFKNGRSLSEYDSFKKLNNGNDLEIDTWYALFKDEDTGEYTRIEKHDELIPAHSDHQKPIV